MNTEHLVQPGEEQADSPEVLDELVVEEMTIDCICGVY